MFEVLKTFSTGRIKEAKGDKTAIFRLIDSAEAQTLRLEKEGKDWFVTFFCPNSAPTL